MKKNYTDKIVVLDIEATCDEPRPSWQSEVIEIGVCLLDLSSLEVSNKRSILIQPTNTPITPFCTKLTTITKEMLDKDGISLADAVDILEDEYQIKERFWASWGFYDNDLLNKDSKAKGIRFPASPRLHLNLKSIVGVERGYGPRCSVSDVMEKFGMQFEGTQHRGHDDAWNIAKIYAKHLSDIRKAFTIDTKSDTLKE